MDKPPNECCISEQQFCSVAMASKSAGSTSAASATVPDGSRWAGRKINNNVFQTGQVQHLHIEFRDESQMALLSWRNGGRNARQGGHKRFVIYPQLKSAPSKKRQKCLIAACARAAKNSRSNVE
jgi:hypothetical protein